MRNHLLHNRAFEENRQCGRQRLTEVSTPDTSNFRANKGGMIINISSMAGRIGLPLLSLYNASKYAIEGFSESLYYELATQNINIKLIEPRNVATNFTGRSLDLIKDDSLDMYRSYFETVLQKQTESFKLTFLLQRPLLRLFMKLLQIKQSIFDILLKKTQSIILSAKSAERFFSFS